MDKQKIEFTKSLILSYVIMTLAKDRGITTEEAQILFMSTKTYMLLDDTDSHLWAESQEYTYDMLLHELSGDIEGWLKL